MADTPRKRSAVPASRVSRMLRFGMLSGELALSAAVAGAKQLSRGRRPDVVSALLTPGNAELLARRLAALRGPAMKVGQMLSLQSEDILPAEFRNALSMLRSQGYAMPDSQLKRVLGREYGKGWESKFDDFSLEPAAAASIGQLHRARKHSGRLLALKIQYPGVARSVDSDVDNLAGLLRRLDFLPGDYDILSLADEAKRQLRLECDYVSEARHLEHYRRLVADMPEVVVPRVDRTLTTRHILAMDWVDGDPLDTVTSEAVPQARRNAIARTLQVLMFREMFEFRFMQTDPNAANYLYLPATQQLALLDLGSVTELPTGFSAGYQRICRGLLDGDRRAIREAALEIGYARRDDPEPMIEGVVDFTQLVCEPLAHRGIYDFAGSNLIGRARDLGLRIAFGHGLPPPPPRTMFLHRKLVGTFLLCARLHARINVRSLIEPFL